MRSRSSLRRSSWNRTGGGLGGRARLAGQEGAALLMAMVAVLLLTVAVLQARSAVDIFERMAYSTAGEAQATYLARSGLFLVQAALNEDDDKVDSFADDWAAANNMAAIPVGEVGWVTGRVQDEEGKLNVNRLVTAGGDPDPAQVARLWTLLTLVGLADDRADEIVDSLLDWIDTDSSASPFGAEDEFYGALPVPYAPSNAPFRTVGELALVKGLGWALLFKGEGEVPPLSSFLTVHGDASGLVNINTAPAEVIMSLTPEGAEGVAYLIERELAEEMISVRSETPFESISHLKELVPAFHDDLFNQVAPLIDVRSSHFSASVMGQTERASVTAYGVFARSGGRAELVYYRRF